MEAKKCPHCRRPLETEDRNDPLKRVVKVRLFKYRVTGGPLIVKCPHCRQLVQFPIASND